MNNIKMSILDELEQKRRKYNEIVHVIGDNNAELHLNNINRDYYLIQVCNNQVRKYTKTTSIQRKLDGMYSDFKHGKKISIMG